MHGPIERFKMERIKTIIIPTSLCPTDHVAIRYDPLNKVRGIFVIFQQDYAYSQQFSSLTEDKYFYIPVYEQATTPLSALFLHTLLARVFWREYNFEKNDRKEAWRTCLQEARRHNSEYVLLFWYLGTEDEMFELWHWNGEKWILSPLI